MRIAGLDVSTNLGWAVNTEVVGSGVWHHPPNKEPRYERYRKYMADIGDMCDAYTVTDVFTERLVASPFGAAITLIELGALLRNQLDERNIRWYEVSPMTLKKFCTGDGHAKKELMLLNVYKRWQFETDDNNVADAFALMKFGEAVKMPTPEVFSTFDKVRAEVVVKYQKGLLTTV